MVAVPRPAGPQAPELLSPLKHVGMWLLLGVVIVMFGIGLAGMVVLTGKGAAEGGGGRRLGGPPQRVAVGVGATFAATVHVAGRGEEHLVGAAALQEGLMPPALRRGRRCSTHVRICTLPLPLPTATRRH